MTSRKLKIAKPAPAIKEGKIPAPANHEALLERLAGYDRIVVGFSGGKDSIACVLRLLELGVDKSKLRLFHHDVDGIEEQFMDWPVTRSYCAAFAEALGLELRFSWREGGLKAELLKEDEQSRGVTFEAEARDEHGEPVIISQQSSRSKVSTRRRWPALGANLQTRWCSASAKIDVMAYALRNDPAYAGKRILVVTGERREESSNRATYAEWDLHRTDCQRRPTHVWRSVIDFSEQEVWDIMERHNVRPHPAYELGFGRTSCMTCIFGSPDQWATVRDLAPAAFQKIAVLEQELGHTIRKDVTVVELADQGSSTASNAADQLRAISQGEEYSAEDIITAPGSWTLPAGAFKECGGPS